VDGDAETGGDDDAGALATDLANIERAVEVPLLVLTSGLKVRRFSQAMGQVCGLGALRPDVAFAAVPWSIEMPRTAESVLREVLGTGTPASFEAHAVGRAFDVRIVPYLADDRRVTGLVVSFVDSSGQQAMHDRVERERMIATETLSAFAEGFIKTDRRGLVELLNPAAAALTEWPNSDAVGRSLDEILTLSPDGARHRLPNLAIEAIRAGTRIKSELPVILVGRAGHRTVVEYAATPISGDGAVVTLRDVGERERLTAEIEWRGSHDVLTGMLNRFAFEHALGRALEAARHKNVTSCLLYLDLDKFKVVNDTAGHIAGDQLLRDVTRVLREAVRSADVVARIGGDEFALILENCGLEDGEMIAANLIRKVGDLAFSWGERSYAVGLSVGLAVIDRIAASTTFDLMADADIALYEAKIKGGGRVEIYRQDDDPAGARAQFTVLTEINRALSEDSFVLYCQPIVATATGAWSGIEVLVRLRDRGGRLMQPGTFLPAAERYGLIRRLDRAVVRKTFKALGLAARTSKAAADLDVHINVAGSTLSDREFLEFVRAAAAEDGIRMEQLVFEITESAAISDLAVARSFVSGIRLMGGRIALDDFGKGMSSFDYLRTLEVDIIKLDGAFVGGVADDPINQAIVRATVDVARAMKVSLVAEMVSSQADAAFLRSAGVDHLQGYLVAQPEPIEDWFARLS